MTTNYHRFFKVLAKSSFYSILATCIIFLGTNPAQSNQNLKRVFARNFMRNCMNSYYKRSSQMAISEAEFKRLCQCNVDILLTKSSQELIELDKSKDPSALEEVSKYCLTKEFGL